MPTNYEMELNINAEELIDQLNKVDKAREGLEQKLKSTQKKTKETWMLAVGIAQASWQLTETILRQSGVAINATVRAAIQGTLTAATILTPILTAAALTPGMKIAAGIGLAQVGLAIMLAHAADKKSREIETRVQNFDEIIDGISGFAGAFHYS